jgi:hypothetical protein
MQEAVYDQQIRAMDNMGSLDGRVYGVDTGSPLDRLGFRTDSRGRGVVWDCALTPFRQTIALAAEPY